MDKNTKTLFISNISTQVSPLNFRDYFSEIGPLQRWHLTRDKETGDLLGTANITYARAEDATKAVATYNKSNFEGNCILVQFNKHKDGNKQKSNLKLKTVSKSEDDNLDQRNRPSSRKGRLVIRNLSYKASEENLREYFLPYGSIKDACILKYPDGRMKGVGFLEFANFSSACKAIESLNMKLFLGRPIAVDFAIPKHDYEGHKGKPIKNEYPDINNSMEVSTSEEMAETLPKIKVESDTKDETEPFENQKANESDMETKSEDEEEDESDNEDGNSGYSSDDEDEDDEDEDKMDTDLPIKPSFAHNPISKDVLEGKTLFIRNISFNTTKEKVEEILSEFGGVKYVIFCKEKSTQRFTGRCFAQYLTKESCDACLEAYDDPAQKALFKLDGRTLMVDKAIGRSDLAKQINKNSKEKEKQDTRNLYLAREGVIREGTKSAFGASKADLLLRTQREIVKRKMLMNYNIYVSPIRLCIHNLPATLNDKELLYIFKANSARNSEIKECRIMRNLYDLDDEGKPKSKCYAFVAFTNHENALAALRNINNNPAIFTPKQRPIVEFSLENKAALRAKENRLKKSLSNNKHIQNSTPKQKPQIEVKKEEVDFMGTKCDPNKKGITSLATHIGPKIRHRDRDSKSKITRNQINNQMRNNKRGKRQPTKGKKTSKRKMPPGKKAKKLKKIRVC